MNARRCVVFLIACAAFVVVSTLAEAQSTPSPSWRDAFAHGFQDPHALAQVEKIGIDSGPSYLGSAFGRCDVGAPDSVVLVGEANYGRGEAKYAPTFTAADQAGRINAPRTADTLKVHVAQTICGLDGVVHAFVLDYEHSHIYMDVPTPAASGMIWIYAALPHGGISELRWSPTLAQIESLDGAKRRLSRLGWSPRAINTVLSGSIYVGMTAAMVREAWGEPEKVNRTITAYTRTEQWVYGPHTYVYVENNRVTAIQQ